MLRKLQTLRLPPRLAFLGSKGFRYAFDALLVIVFGAVLSGWLNIRFPLPIPGEAHLLIALEVPMAFALLALAQHLELRLRWWMFAIVSTLALLVRLFITADNVSQRFVFRDFRIPLDLHLVPEFFRLMYDTSPAKALASYAASFVVFLVMSFAGVMFILRHIYKSSRRAEFRHVIAGYVLLAGGAVAAQELGGPLLYTREVSLRVNREVKSVRKLPAERKKILKTITEVGERIGQGNYLDKLQGNNVLFFFVESYGRTVFVHPEFEKALVPRYRAMEKNLEAEGFHVASDFLTSPTYGGFSWFAHQTLDTGVKVVSHLHSQLLDEQKPLGFADRFRSAGYRPVFVAPGTTRPWPGMDNYYGFREHYFSWEFGYEGPRYGWPTMADQFVLSHIQHDVIEKSEQPLFIQYALVSSHAPFSNLPRYVEDWSKIGNGSILHETGSDRFKVTWGLSGEVTAAYTAAVTYEMRVMEGYLSEFVKDDTLVIFVGDHQPHQLVTGPNNLTWSVPIHVVSRNPDFVAPFLERGYVPGMVPTQPLPHVGMERFMEEFLADFSTEPLPVEPGIWPPVQERVEAERAHAPEPTGGGPAERSPETQPTLAPAAVRDANL